MNARTLRASATEPTPITLTPIASDLRRLRAALAQRPTLNWGEQIEVALFVRDGIERLELSREPVSRTELLVLLNALGLDPELLDDGRVSISCEGMQAAATTGALLTQHAPRSAGWLIDRMESGRRCVWWMLPAEECAA